LDASRKRTEEKKILRNFSLREKATIYSTKRDSFFSLVSISAKKHTFLYVYLCFFFKYKCTHFYFVGKVNIFNPFLFRVPLEKNKRCESLHNLIIGEYDESLWSLKRYTHSNNKILRKIIAQRNERLFSRSHALNGTTRA